jgi:hypothetical protein
MVAKINKRTKCMKEHYKRSIHPTCFSTRVTILREVHYKGWIHRDITEVCKQRHRCKILSFKNT